MAIACRGLKAAGSGTSQSPFSRACWARNPQCVSPTPQPVWTTASPGRQRESLLAITVHEELARVEGLPVAAIRLSLMLLIAVVIAVAMKIVGVLLITSLLIIPAAAAQRHSRTPEQMAFGASLIGIAAVCGGLSLSWFQDTPAGPSIVVTAAALFLLSFALPRRTA
jgi:ABC-type Mn2+/Zn2+ transport system permease subunit